MNTIFNRSGDLQVIDVRIPPNRMRGWWSATSWSFRQWRGFANRAVTITESVKGNQCTYCQRSFDKNSSCGHTFYFVHSYRSVEQCAPQLSSWEQSII